MPPMTDLPENLPTDKADRAEALAEFLVACVAQGRPLPLVGRRLTAGEARAMVGPDYDDAGDQSAAW